MQHVQAQAIRKLIVLNLRLNGSQHSFQVYGLLTIELQRHIRRYNVDETDITWVGKICSINSALNKQQQQQQQAANTGQSSDSC